MSLDFLIRITVSLLFSRHKKKIAFLAVGESKALNDKTVIYRDGCICLDPLIIGKTNFDARDLHCRSDSLSQNSHRDATATDVYTDAVRINARFASDGCLKPRANISNRRAQAKIFL
jgi:hypothetical protein